MTRLLIALIACSLSVSLYAAGSGSFSSSNPSKLSKSEKLYNQGVELMLDKEFVKAERKFRNALAQNDTWAEAHNNLAYTLRKQGPDKYNIALNYYNKAIKLDPELPEPYMYRGVLHMQMGNQQLAEQDLAKLIELNSTLANELEYVIERGEEKNPEQFFGVSGKVKG